jgi:glycosyltransferase involved in cell wall biosynthesis
MIERNIDRIPPNAEKVIIPWKIFDSVGFGVGNEPAYRFYQPSLTANALIQVIAYFMKLADELSGVPAYAHGDVTVGGAGRTASGLNLLIANASRGLREVVMNIDSGMIEPDVKRTYYFNVIDFYGLHEEIPDLNIRAKGSLILMEKMMQTQRMLELLQLTNNPIDLNLLGLEGRKYLLEHIFKNFGIHNFIPLQFTPSKCCEEPRKELVISSSNGVIAYAGRLTPKKDPLTVIKAFQKFVILFSDIAARLHIIGDGPLFKGCERLCKGLGLSDRVVLTGVLEREKYLNTLSRQMYTFILQKGMEFLC